MIEAKSGLQGEAHGMYTKIRRPSNKAVDLDFEIDSSKGYTHVDYKTPIDFQDLADKKEIDVSNFPSIIGNLEKGDKLELGNNEKFSNEILLNQSLQCSILGGINFVNLTFKNIDFTGSFFSKTIFENCRFSNVILRKSEFWSCTFLECQMTESNLTRADFNSSTFKNCEFLNSNLRASNFMDFEFREIIFKNSNLDLILVEDVKVWKSNEWIEIKNESNFEKILKDMN